ncbi:Homeobox protein BEL1 [Musa troglodytarum]|uniref:Homeobox protein BEL1 n=1 Tax=Musa troglodytarum TaxID=320322 RepID=A0A9E7JPD9_9LILI|nr:Homeobox protein BEL1 [Musa troglodytarum]
MSHHQQTMGYTNFSSTIEPVMQSFQQSQELYSLQTGMEMLRIPSKHQENSDNWRASFPVIGSSAHAASCSFPQPSNENLMATPERLPLCPWQPPNQMLVEEPRARFLFPPCEGNGQSSSSGLSLSLNHAETSNSSYDQPQFEQDVLPTSRDELFQNGRFFRPPISTTTSNLHQPSQHLLKISKYLLAAQDLLNEFCNMNTTADSGSSKQKDSKTKQRDGGGSSSSTSLSQSLYSLDIHELQARKVKLLSMREEVDRRYRRYRDRMKTMVSSFEAMAGEGAVAAYSTLASKVMSRHFGCLRDRIAGQIQAIRRQMGEKDAVAERGSSTRGETPRLKLIDQRLRQQKAFQQAGVIESQPWRPQRGLPQRSISILRAWLFEHFLHPYPSDVDKHILARQTGLSRSQVSNWFINARVRLWKPMVEEMYLEEILEQEDQTSLGDKSNDGDAINPPNHPQSGQNQNSIYNSCEVDIEEQKPAAGQLLTDSGSLSWIVSNSSARDRISSKSSDFGVVDLDFSSYNHYYCSNQNFGSGVSLTLGLQQHNGGGSMRPSFPPSLASQQSLVYSKEQMEECHPSQFSILDRETQTLPYSNLMGAQLLRDLAG